MNKNIENQEVFNLLDIKKYWKENIDFINKNPEIEKIAKLFQLNEWKESLSIMKKILEKSMLVDNSTKELKKIKKNLA
jgi:hypothetical protein